MAQGAGYMDFYWSPSLPKMTRKTAMKKALMQTTSLHVMLSPRSVTPIRHAIMGLRLHTMPTVDTLKKLILLKAM